MRYGVTNRTFGRTRADQNGWVLGPEHRARMVGRQAGRPSPWPWSSVCCPSSIPSQGAL